MMMLFGDRGVLCRSILLVIIIGLIIRLAVGYLLTYNYDVYHWALTISNFQAGNGLYEVAGYYYSPVWGYLLGVFSQFTYLFGIDLLGERFTEMLFTEDYVNFYRNSAFVTSLGFNTALTCMIALFDLVNAYLVFWIVREVFGDADKARICFAAWFLCAFVITVGSAGGMFDTVSATFTLLCIATLIKGQEFLAGGMFAAAFLLKFFPGFLIFIMLAYIWVKHRDQWKLRMAKAVIGALAVSTVLMLPQIMDGHIMDSFSFLYSRATASNGVVDILMKYDSIIAYSLILIGEVLLARMFIKKEHADIDKGFLWFALIAIAMVFLNPSSPQYVLVMAPFLVIAMVCNERKLWIPFAILSVGTSLYALSPIMMDLTSIVLYGGLLPFESWASAFLTFESSFLGISMTDAWSLVGGIIQYAGILAIAAIAVQKHLTEKSLAETGIEKERTR